MKKIGICGNFGREKESGQTVKTKMLFREIMRGGVPCSSFDTYRINRTTFYKLFGLIRFVANNENIIVMPAQNGLKVLTPLLRFINLFFHRKLWYVVIGGWLPDFLPKHRLLRAELKKFDGIFVEANSMKNRLADMGFKNVYFMPNFKDLTKVETIRESKNKPFKICTFSRVTESKGIGDAIKTVKLLNSRGFSCTLDIFGAVDESYGKEFDELLKTKNVYYRGVADSDKTTELLSRYDALFFPTFYDGEGFPGTILDAFYAGLPVVASDWKYNSEIIGDEINGLIVSARDIEGYVKAIIRLMEDDNLWKKMETNNLRAAELYEPRAVISEMLYHMNIII